MDHKQDDSGWAEPQGHRPPGARRRHGARRLWPGRDRPCGRRGVLQHRDDRLRGDPHRSFVCGPDHHLHVPAHRQCRHQRGRHRDRQHGGDARRARRHPAHRHHRAVELARDRASRPVAQAPRRDRARRHRYARADQPDPREGHAERRDRAFARRHVRSRRAEEGSARVARPRRHGPRADGDERPALRLGRDRVEARRRLRPADQRRIPCRGDRLRHQAQHPAPARRHRRQGDGGAGDDLGRRYPRDEARRRVPVERPRRPGRDRRIRGAGDQDR